MIKRTLACIMAVALATGLAYAQESEPSEPSKPEAKPATRTAPSKPDKPDFPPIADVVKKAEKLPKGFMQLYKKDDALYAEISSSAMNRDFMLSASIARGVGRGSLVAGMTVWEWPRGQGDM